MSSDTQSNRPLSEEELQDLVASSDAGGRNPVGNVGIFLAIVAAIWSIFQVVLASPISNYVLPGSVVNNSRQFHLAFAMFLAFAAYPALKSSPRGYIPIQDWIMGLLGAFVALYGYFFYDKIVNAGGLADDTDKWVALGGLLLLFEAARRALGPAMAIIATIFLAYVFFGSSEYVPEVIRWKGASLKKAMSHMWITSEGVFGIALGVSTKFVFLFVLFGALLDKAGAGNYFIKMAFGALGHLRGGPAKAAVVGSAATGLISGSSIANVVTTGTFTIPLMKRVGFSSEQAGSVEVASSVNGQIMPPVMGAAAFLMVEYVGISYVEVITHAFLPAAISYIALVYIVHLEAVKRNMPTLGDRDVHLARTVVGMLSFFLVFAGLCYSSQFPVDAVTSWAPSAAGLILSLIVCAIYVVLLYLAAQVPDLEPDDPNAKEVTLPVIADIYKAGLHYLLPIIVLVYFLMIEQKSPGLSAFWATALLFVILLTQKPLKAIFRGESDVYNRFIDGVADLWQGLIDGARNMIGIALATATAGVIVGTVTLTGVGQVMADLVEFLSGGNLILMLIMVGILSLILGMGLPTTANYIVVSSLMAGVVVELGAQSGLIVPLIAVHLFVFYFGIMADVTPPVGLASFAAAAVSGGDAIKTGFTAFFYSLRTVALPFVFIFNTDLLLIDVTWVEGIIVAIFATIAILVFTAGTMGYFLTHSRIYESIALIFVAFALFRPDFFMDRISPPFQTVEPAAFEETIGQVPPGTEMRLVVSGPDFDTLEMVDTTVVVTVGEEEGGAARVEAMGLLLFPEDGLVKLEEPLFGTPVADDLGNFDYYGDEAVRLTSVSLPSSQPPKQLIYIPAMVLLGLIALLQRGRAARQEVLA
ncbi:MULTISPECIES: TRAP transporter permease [unclassified Ruegeria]|uniref:TRAP transporter permease n=1 Tax=unclassified Ruegeria TaxID=2625375 RepID=UPI0014894ECE|nr:MULTISPECIES: TRAP transporter permease [unclassified Ruegeria]NOD33543.1 TRAP transporter fused permease subunit [Ruegeria sp. HKCCD7296]NOD46158.1 TRAP transporter fused permease subunit [Ruegeria sp. HKCCD5849]NOD50542.1 TRAP transporter fused permease subunit [Ruegeria sp. HKCCD5851]NOD67358.1 TRAP transporter fused permease subunit [Ruegeria sp. HKCCD7303]NOE40782.1 TRAP transporter fused permease subunit [Ruegeria sp. HKCCD7319]